MQKKKAHIRTWWKAICSNIYCFLFIFNLYSSIWYSIKNIPVKNGKECILLSDDICSKYFNGFWKQSQKNIKGINENRENWGRIEEGNKAINEPENIYA
jgi:adenine specific DNA methylase Mod